MRKSIAEDDEEASLPSDCINFLDAKPSIFGSEEMLPEPELEIWARTETSIGLGWSLQKKRSFSEGRGNRGRFTERLSEDEYWEGEERKEGLAAIVVKKSSKFSFSSGFWKFEIGGVYGVLVLKRQKKGGQSFSSLWWWGY